jgi:thiol:disulfide interchange protein DsbC
MNRWLPAVAASLLLAPFGAGIAAGKGITEEHAKLAETIGAKVEELRPTDIPGIYEFTRGPNIGYVTADGRYYIFGDLYERATHVNITDLRRGELHLKAINAAVPESEMLVFGPASARHTITVFTDLDCGYCRQLHKDVPQLNKQGVRVRYIFFPRTGPGTSSWKKAEAVWCSPNRNDAFTRAKLGEDVKARACGATPIKRQYELARELGLPGTPGIFTDQGVFLSGYRQPDQLVKELDGAD